MKDRKKAKTNSSNFTGVVTGGLTAQGNERRVGSGDGEKVLSQM